MLSARPGGVRLGRAVAACWRLECAYVCVGRARQAARAARSLVEGSARWLVWEPRCHLPLGRHLRLIEPPRGGLDDGLGLVHRVRDGPTERAGCGGAKQLVEHAELAAWSLRTSQTQEQLVDTKPNADADVPAQRRVQERAAIQAAQALETPNLPGDGELVREILTASTNPPSPRPSSEPRS